MMRFFLFPAFVVMLASGANAASYSVTIGDVDGFGGQTAPGATGVSTGHSFSNGAFDPPGMDEWLFQQSGGVAAAPSFDFDLIFGAGESLLSATLDVLWSGMSDNRGPWNVNINGNLVGQITNPSNAGTTATLDVFNVDVGFLSAGSNTLSFAYQDTQAEGYAIDSAVLNFSTIDPPAVPLPASLPLALAALGGLTAVRRFSK